MWIFTGIFLAKADSDQCIFMRLAIYRENRDSTAATHCTVNARTELFATPSDTPTAEAADLQLYKRHGRSAAGCALVANVPETTKPT
ncbi:MAG TPA: hypothetical protein VFV64_07620 [Permianibacter sp.]|nr:hypothetical protein [Permianibacter sp.]